MDRYRVTGFCSAIMVSAVVALSGFGMPADSSGNARSSRGPAVVKTDAQWRKQLTPQEYEITRKKGTEAPFTGAYWNFHKQGSYKCTDCGKELFSSDSKFDSGCGWPSFFVPAKGAEITETVDSTLGMTRTEVTCTNCGAHLGHVFEDGPQPTGLRYCINSASIKFTAAPAAARSTPPSAGASGGKALVPADVPRTSAPHK